MNKTTNPRKPLANQAKDEKDLQVARFLANERKTFFQIILSNLLQHQAFVKVTQGIKGDGYSDFMTISVRAAIDAATDGADYALSKLYPVEKKEA